MKIAIGSDHAGYQLKDIVVNYLKEQQYEVVNFGVDNSTVVDYTDIAIKVAEAVGSGEYDRGILICGSGIGMSIAANKIPGVRAALCTDPYCARMSREHNDANILALGERVIGRGIAIDIVQTWLSTEFSNGERHVYRLGQIADLEKRYGGKG